MTCFNCNLWKSHAQIGLSNTSVHITTLGLRIVSRTSTCVKLFSAAIHLWRVLCATIHLWCTLCSNMLYSLSVCSLFYWVYLVSSTNNTSLPQFDWNIVESDIKHIHNLNPNPFDMEFACVADICKFWDIIILKWGSNFILLYCFQIMKR